MTIYFNEQAQQYIEKAERESAGIFEQDGKYVAYHYNYFGDFDVDTFESFNEAFTWVKTRR